MKIFYVTNARLPTEKAHGLATVKLCEAFARHGHEVVIFHPWRVNPLRQDVYAYYGLMRNFRIVTLPNIDLLWLGFGERLFFVLQLFSFSKVAALWLFLRYGWWGGLRNAVIFSHDHVPLFFASFIAPNIAYDIHRYPGRSFLYRLVLRRARLLAVQTRSKVGALGADFGIPPGRIVSWPNGTDVGRFDIPLSWDDARRRLGLPLERRIALYSGSLQSWKGAETLIQAAEFLPAHVSIYIVGGDQRDAANFQFSIPNVQNRVTFVGQKPWLEIPLWLKAADVLVIPNTAKDEESRLWTSPMKLFEYMASGRPIVASDLPSIREIVDETMVFFAEPDSPQSLAAAITQALGSPEEAKRRAAAARQEVSSYTWQARAERLLAAMRKS